VRRRRESMAGYYVLQVRWESEEAKRGYVERLGKMIESHGGEFIVASPEYRVAEGSWKDGLFLIIRFLSMDALRAWYDSPEYAPIREFRLQHSRSDAIIVEGD
jgi:uncharacterized protein (DUF1330 family)